MHLKRISGLALLAEILRKPPETIETPQGIAEIIRKPQKCLREPPKTAEISLKIAGNHRNLSENRRKSQKFRRKPKENLQKIFADKRTHPNAEKPMGAAVSRSELNCCINRF